MIERRQSPRTLIAWKHVDPACFAAREFNLVVVGQPETGPAYVIRYIGTPPTFYLFGCIYDRDSEYIGCDRNLGRLYAVAEQHLLDARGVRAPSQPASTPPAKQSIKQGTLF